MKKVKAGVFVLGFIFCYTIPAFNQAEVTVQVKIEELGYNGKKRDPVFKFYRDSVQGSLLNAGGQCYAFSHKDDLRRFMAAKDTALAGFKSFLNHFQVDTKQSTKFKLVMECFDKDRGDICTFTPKDDKYVVITKEFDLAEIAPGDFTDTIRLADDTEGFYALVKVRFFIPPPTPISISQQGDILAANESLELKSSFPLQNRRGILFEWQVSKNEGKDWQKMAFTPRDSFTVSMVPLADLFGGSLRQTQKILFRLKASSRDTMVVSSPISRFITPKAPVADKYNITLGKTCNHTPTGTITMRNIEISADQMGWILIQKDASPAQCNFQKPDSTNCPGFVKAGVIQSSTLDIRRVPAGEYNLVLYNAQMEVGQVFSAYPVEVAAFQPFVVEKFILRNPSCNDNKPGEVSITMGGGDWEKASAVIEPVSGVESRFQNIITFKDLSGASYQLRLTDGCSQIIDTTFTILSEPPRLLIDSIKRIKSTSKESADFRIHIRNGAGPFRIFVKDQKGYNFTETSPSMNILLKLFKGRNDINITDESDMNCLKVDTFLIVKSRLPIKIFPITKVPDFSEKGRLNWSEGTPMLAAATKKMPLNRVKISAFYSLPNRKRQMA